MSIVDRGNSKKPSKGMDTAGGAGGPQLKENLPPEKKGTVSPVEGREKSAFAYNRKWESGISAERKESPAFQSRRSGGKNHTGETQNHFKPLGRGLTTVKEKNMGNPQSFGERFTGRWGESRYFFRGTKRDGGVRMLAIVTESGRKNRRREIWDSPYGQDEKKMVWIRCGARLKAEAFGHHSARQRVESEGQNQVLGREANEIDSRRMSYAGTA